MWTVLINHSQAGVGGGGAAGTAQSCAPSYRWPTLLAGCQPRVSWSMLVKCALIWVWQGNQQPNSTVKLNSAVEHRSASFMLRLQKGKVPQHQFVTESCGTELALREGEKKREGKRGVCVCLYLSVSVRLCVACLLLHPHRLPTTAGRKKELHRRCEWAEWVKEKNGGRMREERVGWVCYKVREPGRMVFLKLQVDSLFFFLFFFSSSSRCSETPKHQ